METPNISTKILDPVDNVTYDVRAYRALTRDELVLAVRTHRQRVKRKPKKGSTIVIVTIIGFQG